MTEPPRLRLVPVTSQNENEARLSAEESAVPLIAGETVGRNELWDAFILFCRSKDEKRRRQWVGPFLAREAFLVSSWQQVTILDRARRFIHHHMFLNGQPMQKDTTELILSDGDVISFNPLNLFGGGAKPLEFRVVGGTAVSSLHQQSYLNALQKMDSTTVDEASDTPPPTSAIEVGDGLISQPNSPFRTTAAAATASQSPVPLQPATQEETSVIEGHRRHAAAPPEEPRQASKRRKLSWDACIDTSEMTRGARYNAPGMRTNKPLASEQSPVRKPAARMVSKEKLNSDINSGHTGMRQRAKEEVASIPKAKERSGEEKLMNDGPTGNASEHATAARSMHARSRMPDDFHATTDENDQGEAPSRPDQCIVSEEKCFGSQGSQSSQVSIPLAELRPNDGSDPPQPKVLFQNACPIPEPPTARIGNSPQAVKADASGGQQASPPEFVVFFVEKGSDMHKDLIHGTATMEGLRTHAELRGAQVLSSFNKCKPPYPTHIVVSERIQSQHSIVQSLGFESDREMNEFLGLYQISCVRRSWIDKGKGKGPHRPPLCKPTIRELHLGLNPRVARKQTPGGEAEAKSAMLGFHQNRRLSEHFAELSKLYRDCAFDAKDEWKSYTFSLLSGRLLRLDFEISTETESLDRLRKTKGFGKSSACIIEQFLEQGTSDRRRLFDKDPKRRAMKVMIGIWGVGKSRATELVTQGYKVIGNVRKAVKDGILKLERNQYIGLLCYEDILEKMSRSEVESIAAVVKNTVKLHYPHAEITIMGSFRRGKHGCGDVDILIADPSYPAKLPLNPLADILDELTEDGHIAYHLTKNDGVKKFETLSKSETKYLKNFTPRGYAATTEKWGCSSWMGVFKSPFSGKVKMRRVDIKFYPYHQRVFASLYFTGNGHFNRSMRLLAKKRHQYRLNDKELFDKTSNKPVLRNPSSEREVFDALHVKWKEPNERDCFDAVETLDGQAVPKASQQELAEEENVEWIE